MPKPKKDVEKLTRKHEFIYSKIKNIETFASRFNIQTQSLKEISSRLETICIYNKEYEAFTDLVFDSLDAEEFELFQVHINTFSNKYHETKSELETLIEKYSDSKVNSNNRETSENQLNIKLPDIQLPIFDGNIANWLTFKDTFTSVIHSNKNISDIVKFTHLLSKLKGDAKETIGHVTLTSAGYKKAWSSLIERYDNKRVIVDLHIDGLCNLPFMKKGNSIELRKLLNACVCHISSLKACDQELTGVSELMIVNMVTKHLDPISRREWENQVIQADLPKWKDMQMFLQNKCRVLESIEATKPTITPTVNVNNKNNFKYSSSQGTSKTFITSNYPQQSSDCTSNPIPNFVNNKLEICPIFFLSLSTQDRYLKVKDLQLCVNCLRKGHYTSDCRGRGCRFCNNRHNSLLHHATQTTNALISNESPNSENNIPIPEKTENFSLQNKIINKSVLLSTAVIHIQDNKGRFHEARALLDSASQSNYITKEFASRLNITNIETNISISSINGIQTNVAHKISTTINSKYDNYTETLDFLIIPKISNSLPEFKFNISTWSLPSNITLADPHFNISRPVDLLLGAEIFFNVLKNKRIMLRHNLPILQETSFGFVIGGKFEQQRLKTFSLINTSINDEPSLHNLMEKFWYLDAIPTKVILSQEEQRCESYFLETHVRGEDGRYQVNLPFNDKIDQLGSSKEQALMRFNHLENKICRDSILKSEYDKFINEYIELGHMSEVIHDSNNPNYYLPHHAVLKPSSSTTKLRVVFDGSAKTSTNLSLNDTLMVGHNVQQDLFSIILRFRKHQYVITSDIAKMYRQININKSQQSFQRIIWRSNPNEAIKIYNLTTVTYGTSAAPYLATRVLNQLAIDERKNYPIASKITLSDFYVDDVLTGADSIEEVKIIQKQLINMLKSGGFRLHKWCSNSKIILEDIPEQDREKLELNNTSLNETIKTLGLIWQPEHDHFLFHVSTLNLNQIITKRTILSDISKLYDPLGLLGPVIITAKLLIQSLWKSHSGWDEIVTQDQQDIWQTFRNSLTDINDIKITRCVIPNYCEVLELHGFSDASESAYGACIYIRCIDYLQQISVSLLCSKTRVAPLKSISLPRLELCAALLLSQLVNKTIEAINLQFNQVYLWSDSKITLAWIATEPYKLKTFVANRVSNIQELTSSFIWKHVRTEHNPADVISRGIMPSNLKHNSMWWVGPQYLHDNNINLFESDYNIDDIKIDELKPKSLNFVVSTDKIAVLYKFSSFTKLQNVIAYCFRFLSNCRIKIKDKRNFGPLSIGELKQSLEGIIKYVQHSEFQSEINCLKQSQQLNKNSKLTCLNPFLDSNGILRVGGRLVNTKLNYDMKHQYLLPANHFIVNILFRDQHNKNIHAGPQLLLSLIRQRFWPINGKNTARKIVRNCISCFKVRPIITQQIMGNLPRERTTPERPFTTTGVDFCGPFSVKYRYQRSVHKVYVSIFVCFVTKAVHLDIVTDATSDAFIACLKRFISRRGKCCTLWSDNATNFVGASNELKRMHELFQSEIERSKIKYFCNHETIEWKFIPPRSPNFGGLWEASVKAFKTHLKRVTFNSTFTYEELNTLIVEIEGIMNSRPLSPMSNDPHDPEPLTPAHFLIGGPISAINEPSYVSIPSNHLSKWRKISQMSQNFWKRFSVEYLHTLQQRVKWKTTKFNLKLGDVVLISDDNLVSTQWLLGVVIDTIPGADSRVRIVNVKTRSGIVKRAISKICKLSID